MAKQKKLYEKEKGVIPIGKKQPPVEKVEEKAVKEKTKREEIVWKPKTALGKAVKAGEITSISQVLNSGLKIREVEIVDTLIPDLVTDFILIGQAHGKFGGGKRRLIRQTQKKTAEGNKPAFTTMTVVGNRDGYVGVGLGTAVETLPAKQKAIKNAKLNIIEVVRGCGSWKCGCGEPHSLPLTVTGRCGSVRVKLMPAPKGAGLVVEDELKKILKLAGYKDVWSKTFGHTRKKINFVNAFLAALKQASSIRLKKGVAKVKYGSISS